MVEIRLYICSILIKLVLWIVPKNDEESQFLIDGISYYAIKTAKYLGKL